MWLGNGTSGRLGKPGCGFSSTEVADEFLPSSGRAAVIAWEATLAAGFGVFTRAGSSVLPSRDTF
jgi:hypothetical protein